MCPDVLMWKADKGPGKLGWTSGSKCSGEIGY